MEWKPSYSIGNTNIDNQHKDLIKIISDFKIDTPDIGRILAYLINYTGFHFSQEEAYMRQWGYPGLDEHIEIHRDLVSQLKEVLLKIKKGNHLTPIEFYYFVTSWLNDHILGEDIKIKEYIDKNRASFVPIKAKMDSANYILEVIPPNLEKIKILVVHGVIEHDMEEFRRKSYLKALYEGYNLDTDNAYNIAMESLVKLEANTIISNQEYEFVKLYIDGSRKCVWVEKLCC